MSGLITELVGKDRSSLEKKKRKDRAKKDFGFFCQTYLLDYFFTDPAEYQQILYDVADTQSLSKNTSKRLKPFINKPFRGDRTIWVIFMFLCLVSLVEVYSATSTLAYKNVHYWAPFVRHGSFLLMGFFAVLILHHIPSKYFTFAVILLPVSITLLVVTPMIGVNINEAHRFLSFMGFQFQPSEFGKMACIIFVAFMLSKQDNKQ